MKIRDTVVVVPTVTVLVPFGVSRDAITTAGVSALLTDANRESIADIAPLVKNKTSAWPTTTGVQDTLSVTCASVNVGDCVGDTVGLSVGELVVGDEVGDTVGDTVGDVVGDRVGEVVGDVVGDLVGDCVGEAVGLSVAQKNESAAMASITPLRGPTNSLHSPCEGNVRKNPPCTLSVDEISVARNQSRRVLRDEVMLLNRPAVRGARTNGNALPTAA